jgi:hypothetical protein
MIAASGSSSASAGVGSAGTSRASTSGSLQSSEFQRVEVRGKTGVIVPATDATREWTPAIGDLEHFEDGLSEGLRKPGAVTDARWAEIKAQLATYTRQYSGRADESGRYLHAFLMCERLDGWDSRRVTALDGDSCFADVFWNMQTDAYYIKLRFAPSFEWIPRVDSSSPVVLPKEHSLP